MALTVWNSCTCFIRKPLSIPLSWLVLNMVLDTGIEYDIATKLSYNLIVCLPFKSFPCQLTVWTLHKHMENFYEICQCLAFQNVELGIPQK